MLTLPIQEFALVGGILKRRVPSAGFTDRRTADRSNPPASIGPMAKSDAGF